MLWFVLLQLAGCAAESGGATSADVSNVEVGMTQSQVFSILGQPQMREAYGPTEFLFYTSSYGASIPIAVVDGKVTSIGRAAYEIAPGCALDNHVTGERSATEPTLRLSSHGSSSVETTS